jgi:hypothetical protein
VHQRQEFGGCQISDTRRGLQPDDFIAWSMAAEMPFPAGMSIGPIINLAGGYIQSLFSNGSNSTSSSTTSSAATGLSTNAPGTSQLPPFAQILNSLQQLQQSSPSQYQTVTRQISTNLQTAAQSATASGNTALATQLNQLSTDFNNASTSNQLPNVQDLAQAIGTGGGHHHHHHHAGSSTTSAGASNVNEFLQSLNGSNGNTSQSALSIIDNTLTGAGL